MTQPAAPIPYKKRRIEKTGCSGGIAADRSIRRRRKETSQISSGTKTDELRPEERKHSLRSGFCTGERPSFEFEQELLDGKTSSVSDEASVRTDDPVAGDDHGDRISIVGSADRAKRLRPTDPFGDPSIAFRPAVWDLQQDAPDRALEVRSARGEGQIERPSFAGEVLPQLSGCTDDQGTLPFRDVPGKFFASEEDVRDGLPIVGYPDPPDSFEIIKKYTSHSTMPLSLEFKAAVPSTDERPEKHPRHTRQEIPARGGLELRKEVSDPPEREIIMTETPRKIEDTPSLGAEKSVSQNPPDLILGGKTTCGGTKGSP